MNRVQSFDHDDVDENLSSAANVDVRVRSSSKHSAAVNSERRFTVTQMTWAVVGTHLATIGLFSIPQPPQPHLVMVWSKTEY